MLRIFTLLFSLFYCIHSYSIEGYTVNFKNIDNSQGLSQNGITAIFQDRDGYMWFGTHFGLNRYDGLNIKSYYAGNSPNELSDNTINSIVQDLAGNIWIATEQGLTVFNPITQQFFNLKKYNSKNSLFSQNIETVKLIDGKIIVINRKGLWSINPVGHLLTVENTKSICDSAILYAINLGKKLESLRIYKKDKNNRYWFTTKNEVIIAKIIRDKVVILKKIRVEPQADIKISTFFQDNYSTVWIGTENNGLYQLKEVKGNFLVTKIYPKNSSSVIFSRVADIIQDHQNNLIVTSRSDGAIRIQKEALKNNVFSATAINYIDLPTKNIRSIYRSRDNTLWIGSIGDGVFFQNNSSLKFKNYQLKNKKNNSIVNNTRSILKDDYGKLWMGTLFEGVFIYDIANLKIHTLLSGKSVFALSKIDKNHTLAGSSDGLYLVTFNNNNYSVKKLNTNPKIANTVFSITHVNNHYWVGTDNNLISFTLTKDFEISKSVIYTNILPASLNSIKSIRIVKYDFKHNFLWIGTQVNGLVKAELTRDFAIKSFHQFNQTSSAIANNDYICDILLVGKNICWVGTRSGLVQIKLSENGSVVETKKFTIQDGLPSNLIQSLQNDNLGNLWIGTNRGLVKWNKSYKAINYDLSDGIQDYEFSEHASYSNSNGLLYFGGIKGVSEFAPHKINYTSYTEPVNISDIIINGINLNHRRNSNESESISLDYFENNVKIDFLSPNYTNPKNCKYSYILEGYDDQWIHTMADVHLAEYKNLPPDNYTFKIKVSNEDGDWNPNYTSLQIKIKSPFWLTFPAFVLYIILLTGLIFLISTITNKRLEAKNKEQLEKQYREQMEKINESKLEFFINISHEIRTPLTLILCSIEKLISNLKLNSRQAKMASTIDKNVNSLLELINELLAIHKMETGNYQLKVQKSDIVLFIKNIKNAFKAMAKSKEIKISMNAYQPEVWIWYDKNALEKIMYNLISNAIKHTNKGGKIVIKISPSKDKNFLSIEVIDNGAGIDPNSLSKIFNRFYHHGGNMEKYVNGFGIGLSLTKSLIELHKGTISVSSELHKGTEFTLNLPLDENAYSNQEKSNEVILIDDELPSLYDSATVDESNLKTTDELPVEKVEFNPEKPTILYVDDNIELLENMSDYFSDTYNIYTAENGKIGVEMALKIQPDVVISDVVMPVMNGLELCTTLKNDVNTSHIPIILLTSKSDLESQFQGIQSGADYYVSKPFNIKILNLTIKNIIDSRNRLKNIFLTNKYKDAGDITTNDKDKEFIDKLLNYVNDHIEEDSLNIINIADEFAMSRSTFYRKVKVITGTTGKDFIDSVRLKKAKTLLTETDLNISEIAYAVGHANPQYFSKWFKSHCKISPTEYVLKHKV